MACDMTMSSVEYKTIPTLTPIFYDNPSVFNFHNPSTHSGGDVGLSSMRKSARAWALIVVLSLKLIPYLLSSTTHFRSLPDISGFWNAAFIEYVVRTVIWWAW